jgi:hypothetical protein
VTTLLTRATTTELAKLAPAKLTPWVTERLAEGRAEPEKRPRCDRLLGGPSCSDLLEVI